VGAAPSATSDPLAWPIVGRADELQRIAVARGEDGSRGVVLMGPAGVGKSRLAREAISEAGDRGALVEWVHATRSAATVPLGALAGLLPSEVRSDDALELMRFSADALRERAGGRPIAVAVDDAHLLDATSAALILHLAVTGAAFVVATVRSGEPCPDAVVSLWKDAGAARLDLRPLTEAETGALAEAALGGPIEETARRWVYDSSQGNVLYVRELLLGAVESGALSRGSGLWRLSRRPPPSHSLTELVSARMTGLTDDVVGVLELLALGEPLRLAEMIELVGIDPLQQAEARGLLSVSPPAEGGEVVFAHPVYGDVIDAGMPALRAHAARLRLAELVGRRSPRSPDDALRIARWLLDAGEPIPLDVLVDAARAANRAGDADLGARLAALAREAGGGVEVALLLARAHYMRRRYREADDALATVEGTEMSEELAGDYVIQRIGVLFWGLEQAHEARALLRRARDWCPGEVWRARLQAMDLQLATLSEGFAGSVEASEKLLADTTLSERTRLRMQGVHLANLYYSGRAREAYALSLQLRPPIPIPHQGDEYTLMVCAAVGVQTGEDWPEVRRWMSQVMHDAVRQNDHFAAGSAATVLGKLDLFAGRYQDAQRWMAESEAQFERHDATGSLVATRLFWAQAAAEAGDASTASALLEKVRGAHPGATTPALKVDLAIASARLAFLEGDHAAARAAVMGSLAEDANMPLHSAKLLYAAMRADAPARELDTRMAAARARCDARMVAAYAGHVAARAARDPAALLETAEAFAAIGADRYAMEAAADAATAFAAAGRQDSARRAAARALELHVEHQGGAAPDIRGVDAADVLLTPRESQLVALAARGMSNAEIADQLVLSVRTVESHIYRAMQKLGVSDRRDLRA
jgi:DNA-binding CsgD family transcriptional regulator